MSEDSVSVTSSRSWFGRMGGAIMGVLIGLILFVVSFPVIIWNEGRAIHRAKTLEIGSKEVISVPDAPADPANEGKLVHVTGDTIVTSGELKDGLFGVSVPAIKLQRYVEMYQWTQEEKSETRKTLGGGEETVTTYSYEKKWTSELIDSGDFQKPVGHQNPAKLPVPAKTFVAKDVTVGDYTLPDNLIGMIDNYESLPVAEGAEVKLAQPVQPYDGGYYLGADPEQPAIGDAKVEFRVVEPGAVSIIARQTQRSFEAYEVKNLGSIELLQVGTHSAANMFTTEIQGNIMLTWILRLAGFLLMFFGLLLMTRPISVAADVVPFFGNLAETGLGLLSFLVALPLTLATVALAWLAYRPLLGIPLLLLAAGGIFLAVRALLKKKAPKPA